MIFSYRIEHPYSYIMYKGKTIYSNGNFFYVEYIYSKQQLCKELWENL